MQQTSGWIAFVVMWAMALGPTPAHAQKSALMLQPSQSGTVASNTSLDARTFLWLYNRNDAFTTRYMRITDQTAYPVYLGAPLLAWGGALMRNDGSYEDAYRLTVSWVATLGITWGLKHLFKRPRPYKGLTGVTPKSKGHGGGMVADPNSFPSGHTAMAFAVVTSWSLSHPQWYWIAPGVLWATSVGLSRIWLGVHYPSDVFAGMLIGVAVGVAVHLLGPHITPNALKANPTQPTGPMLRFAFQL